MDLLSLLTHLINPTAGGNSNAHPQQSPANNGPAPRPSPMTSTLRDGSVKNGLFFNYPGMAGQENFSNNPFNAGNSAANQGTLRVPTNLAPLEDTTDSYTPAHGAVLPDHQYQPNQRTRVKTAPAFLDSLIGSRQGKA